MARNRDEPSAAKAHSESSYQTIAKKRGKKIATIAISRKLLTRAWHLLAGMLATGPATPRP